MARINRKITALDHALAQTGLYEQTPERAMELMKDRGVLAKNLSETETLWLEASERYETARRVQQNAGTA
jgi:hypothetical protein